MPTYTPLQSIQLATDATSFTFSNIPQTYQDLVLVCNYLKSNNAALRLSFNGDTATNYSSTTLYGNGTSALSGRETSVSYFYAMDYITSTSTVPNQTIININNYSNTTTYKTILDRSGGTSDGLVASVGLWRKSTEAINNINISRSSGIFYAGATFDLYGISPVAAQTAQAFGGTEIYYDSSYVYHVFKGSGIFTPYRALTADILVVAGGGGATSFRSGGGGAGGLLGYTSQSLTANTNYAVTVGAGGAGGLGSSSTQNNGNNSQFGSLTASVGGGGGGASGAAGSNGGSGGGGSGNFSGGTATSGQGNAGGAGVFNTPPPNYAIFGAGGGGGASAAGAASNATVNPPTAGNGGAGSSSYSSWGSATGTGHNVSGTYYYAGGGGGGANAGTAGTGGSGGGGNGAAGVTSPQTAGQSGMTNTGGGAGGSSDYGSGVTTNGFGGSGIVIVRYAR